MSAFHQIAHQIRKPLQSLALHCLATMNNIFTAPSLVSTTPVHHSLTTFQAVPRTMTTAATPSGRSTLAHPDTPPCAASLLMQQLQADRNVVISNTESLLPKLQRLYQGGLGKLHVVTDFDCTLTKYWVDGKRSATSHAVVALSQQLPQQAKEAIDVLYDKYYPIEICATMSNEDKAPHMEAWWRAVHDVLISARLCRDDITHMVKACPVTWRPELGAVLARCASGDVPVLVFSAGLADVIVEILAQSNLLTHNVHVISNSMRFSEQPPHTCVGFEEPIIHVLNKNEGALCDANVAYFAEVAHRTNVLLLGDSLGDLKMSHGMSHDVCLTVGFLNHDVDALLPKYKGAFDVVLLHDAPMTWVNELLQGLQ